jgi:predicted double-glycine peptidase
MQEKILILAFVLVLSGCIEKHTVDVNERILPEPVLTTSSTTTLFETTTSTTSTTTTTSTMRYPEDGLFWIEVISQDGKKSQIPVDEGKFYEIEDIRFYVREIQADRQTASLITYEMDSAIYWNTTNNVVKDAGGNFFTYSKVYSSGLRNPSDFIIVENMRYYYTGCSHDTYEAMMGSAIFLDGFEYVNSQKGYKVRIRPDTTSDVDDLVVDGGLTQSPQMMCTTTTLALPGCRINLAFQRQSTLSWCGPAVVQSALRHYGINKRQEDIVSSIVMDDITDINDMMRYIQDSGLYIEFYMGDGIDRERLNDIICRRKHPVIALQRLDSIQDEAGGHYRLIIGLDDTHVYLQDPYRGRFKVTYDEFWQLSKANQATQYDNQMIVVKNTIH